VQKRHAFAPGIGLDELRNHGVLYNSMMLYRTPC